MEHRVSVDGNFTGAINFAMQQNYVPVIRNLIVRNETEEVLSDLDVRIRFEPDFAREYQYFIQEIPAGEAVEISPVRIQLKTEYLFSLTEKLLGVVVVELYRKEERLFLLEKEIELLAADQWNGGLCMPELIAAFVTPNHPVIAKVIQHASEVLKNWTGSPSFTGYQTRNPNNVKLQMGAVYEALRREEIIYNNPPASFEKTGQRVRLAHTVLDQKQGTCLDLALLYGACLEAVGLHPLLIFLRGHACGGCWLEENTFPDCVVDDLSALEKRMAQGAEEMLLVECTAFTSGKNIGFDGAVESGRRHFRNPDEFRYVIDVRRSRGSGIRPIPLQLTETDRMEQGEKEREGRTPEAPLPAALDQSLAGRVTEGIREEGITKQKLWERKLLDFSLRNTLLNFRLTKNAFQIMTADLCRLEDRLSGGKEFQILEIPSEWTGTQRDFRIFEEETDLSLIQNIASQEFESNRLRTFLEPAELDKRLKGLYRSARMSMEENGANTLFLALGFLRWYESDVSEKARYAPLVLVPVDIVRSVRSRGFIIRSRQEEIRVNVTLLAFLQQDYGIVISGLDPLPEDDQGVDLRLVFHTVRQAVMAQRRWNVEEAAYLGLFSFGQFVMWNDLRSRCGEIEKNKVVSSLIEGCMNWEPGEGGIRPERLDTALSPADMAVPMSADSSQMAAIAAAAAGQSFVLHGPPGTGKSQTITNMIANALYQGKSVLFVAEKMAALNVVQKRLADIGLDPFCLELHSNKTNKGTVLARLEKTLEVGRIKAPEEYLQTAERIHDLRRELNAVVEALHQRREYGCSLYEAIERYERYKGHRGKIRFAKETLSGADRGRVEKWEELVRQYKVAIGEMGVYAEHPLAGYEGLTYSMELRERLRGELKDMIEKCTRALPHQEALFRWAGGIGDKSRQTAERLLKVAGAAVMPGAVLGGLLQCPNYSQARETLRRLAETGKEYRGRYALLEAQFEPAVFTYEAGQAARRWKQAGSKWFLPRALEQNRLVKELRLYAKEPETVTKDRIPALYEALCLLEDGKREIQETPSQVTELAAGMFFGVSTDWDALEAALDKTAALEAGCGFFPDRRVVMEAVLRGEEGMLTEHVGPLQEFYRQLDAFLEAWHIEEEPETGRQEGLWLEIIRETLERYADHLEELRNRARKSMIVYSVLRPEQIDLTRTRAEGLAGLKGFLEFAERGRSALAQRADTLVKKEDFLVQDIADAVRGLGYEVKCNIGSSAFKMDMGIVDPEDRERYLLGLLLDGENCREAATARDRFLLQPEVLEGLGWKVMRVWTLDWMDDPVRVLGRIRQGIENARQSREPVEKEKEPAVCFENFQRLEREETPETGARIYESARIAPAGLPDDFYLPENRKKISRVVRTILEKEAPVSRKLLLRKVLGAFGISRAGARVEGIFSAVLEGEEKVVTRDEDREFYWKKEQNPDEYAIYRVGEDESGRRSMDDIPSREIQNAALEVLRQQGSMTRADLVRETGKKFGFSRLGNVIESVVGYVLQESLDKGLLQESENGKIGERM